MKRILKLTCIFSLLVCFVTLTACSNVSEKYATKINDAVSAGESMTKDDVYKDLGTPTAEILVLNNGYALWIKGCDTLEEANQKYEEGKKLKCLHVVFALGKAVSATYDDYDPNEDYSK